MNTNTIEIAKGLRFSKAQEILLHEIFHACSYPTFEHKERTTDEIFINTVSPVFLQVLQNNPELLAYLTYRDKV